MKNRNVRLASIVRDLWQEPGIPVVAVGMDYSLAPVLAEALR